jgi:hypothetical protein
MRCTRRRPHTSPASETTSLFGGGLQRSRSFHPQPLLKRTSGSFRCCPAWQRLSCLYLYMTHGLLLLSPKVLVILANLGYIFCFKPEAHYVITYLGNFGMKGGSHLCLTLMPHRSSWAHRRVGRCPEGSSVREGLERWGALSFFSFPLLIRMRPCIWSPCESDPQDPCVSGGPVGRPSRLAVASLQASLSISQKG